MTDSRTAAGLAAAARDDLAAWVPGDPQQDALRREYLTLLDTAGEAAVRRDGGPEHLTASCFVVTPDHARVLLCYHRKGRFWVQLGGHLEPGDASLADAALREAREEGGIADVVLASATPVDVHRHDLDGGFGACRAHWDVGFLAYAAASSVPVVSDESERVAWFAVDDLPDGVVPDLPGRLRLAGITPRRD